MAARMLPTLVSHQSPPLPKPGAMHPLEQEITPRAREEFEALLAARQRIHTGEYKATYAKRAGCEGTLSRGVRRCRLRRTRYVGQERVPWAWGCLRYVTAGEYYGNSPSTEGGTPW